jgi:2-isopropylmalate synthase
MRDPATYEHVDPEWTGNSRRVLVSDLSGKSNVLYKAAEMGIDVTGNESNLPAVVKRIKELENQGFQFEAAEGSFKLMLEQAVGNFHEFFRLESYSVATERGFDENLRSEATVKLWLATSCSRRWPKAAARFTPSTAPSDEPLPMTSSA